MTRVLRHLAHRLWALPLRIRDSFPRLFDGMLQGFRHLHADLECEQLAPEDAYLSCEFKSMQLAVLLIVEILKLTGGFQTTMFDVRRPTYRYVIEVARKC
jgi:hypothetical protein